MKIAVTGYKGRLGSQLIYCGCDPLECDVTKSDEVRKAIERVNPDVIINCAAYTRVDDCEDSEKFELALKVNVHGVNNLRSAFNGKLIHISTDYIFSGKHGSYSESNKKDFNPINSYGFSKWGGEIVAPGLFPENTCIVRTTGLYGGVSNRPDFASMVVDYLTRGKELRVSMELMGNQTYVPHLAEALLKLAMFPQFEHPIIHIGSQEVISRYEFALMLAGAYGFDKTLIYPVRNDEIEGWVAKRPKKGGLKTSLAKKLRLPIYTVLDGIKAYRNDTRQI